MGLVSKSNEATTTAVFQTNTIERLSLAVGVLLGPAGQPYSPRLVVVTFRGGAQTVIN